MTLEVDVDGTIFTFGDRWLAAKFDDTPFYRNQFAKIKLRYENKIFNPKAVDLLAVSPENHAYLIEVKNYSKPDTEKPSELSDVVLKKVVNTLAALVPIRLRSSDTEELKMASKILKCQALSVVLHCQNPDRHKPIVVLADMQQQLRRTLKAVDPHVRVSDRDTPNVPWTTT